MKSESLHKNIWKSLIIVIALALIGGGLMGIRAKRHQTTTYTAKTNIVISHDLNNIRKTSDGQDNVVNADLNMMPTYEEIAKNVTISKYARQYLSPKMKKEYSLSDINSSIDAKTHPQSLVLTLEATTKSKKDSVTIANASAKAFVKELPKVQPGVGNVKVLSRAVMSDTSSKTSPSIKKHSAVGIALGGLIGLIISFVFITSKELSSKGK